MTDWANWHRTLSWMSALLLGLMLATGVGINHASGWALDRTALPALWMRLLYGARPPEVTAVFVAKGHWVASAEGRVLAAPGENLPLSRGETLLGVFERDAVPWAVTDQQVLALSPDLDDAFPLALFGLEEVSAVGHASSCALVIKAQNGPWCLEIGELAGRPLEPGVSVDWQQAQPVGALENQLLRAFYAQELTIERLLQDIHSGRVLPGGMYLLDALGVVLLLQVWSGLWLWRRRRRFQRRTR